MSSTEYLEQLKADQAGAIGSGGSFNHVQRLVAEEIDRVEKGTKYIEVHTEKTMKLQEKVIIPINEHPKFNFVGKLLGPQGNSLKRLQAETGTKMSILGKGSMREKKKEDELRRGEDPKYSHLNEDLHVLVEVFAVPTDAHNRMAHALGELKKYLIPVSQDFHDEIRQQQLEELMYLNGDEVAAGGPGGPGHHPVGPGGPGGPGGPVAARGRGRGRGLAPPGPPRGRGGAPLLATPGRGGPVTRGLGAPRGGPALRGAAAPRGARGAPSGRGGPLSRPIPPQQPPAPVAQTYTGEEEYLTGYGNQGYEEQQTYGYTEEYRDPYDSEYSTGPRNSNGHNPSVGSQNDSTQFFDYAHGVGTGPRGGEAGYTEGAYSGVGSGGTSEYGLRASALGLGDSWGQNSTGFNKALSTGFKAPLARAKPDYRSHPYGTAAPRGGRPY